MVEEPFTKLSKQGSTRHLDIDISAMLIAERLVGEVFGWALVDWSVVEPHKGRRFFFGHQHGDGLSIHDQLKPMFDRCNPAQNDFSALRPSPVINANLTRLVGCLCRHLGKHGLPTGESDHPVLERTAEQDHLHLAAVDRLLGRIDNDPILGERSRSLKRIAATAENELEKHFADLINQRLEGSFLTVGVVDRYRVNGLREQARSRVEETRRLNEHELIGLAAPKLVLDDEALIRIEMAKILLSRFPYVRNYELMLHAELAMLQRPLTPRFARERMLARKAGFIDEALIERWERAVAGLSSIVGQSESGTWCGALIGRTIVICGSGPLPMTAIFLHLFTGAAIVLIDEDPTAAERSKRLITNLEQLDILKPDALTVRQRNAGDMTFHAPGRASGTSVAASVDCDAVMIASLVDHEAKASIAAQFSSDPGSPELLIMRSATGLSARLAYDPVPTEALCKGRLAYCGETLPATQVATHLERTEAVRRGVACMTSSDLLAIAHADVVNTTEVYRTFPGLKAAFGCHFDATETIEEWIDVIERVGERAGSGKF